MWQLDTKFVKEGLVMEMRNITFSFGKASLCCITMWLVLSETWPTFVEPCWSHSWLIWFYPKLKNSPKKLSFIYIFPAFRCPWISVTDVAFSYWSLPLCIFICHLLHCQFLGKLRALPSANCFNILRTNAWTHPRFRHYVVLRILCYYQSL